MDGRRKLCWFVFYFLLMNLYIHISKCRLPDVFDSAANDKLGIAVANYNQVTSD